jgi:uncharacterized RDD family membrane protein YckC
VGRRLQDSLGHLLRDQSGAVLAEAIIVIPFVTLFSVGILEFGNMFWQKEQIEVGLRDAARYVARCQTNVSFAAACNIATAAPNIAFYGTPAPGDDDGLRVPGWGPDLGDITIMSAGGVIRASTSHVFVNSPLFGWLGLDAITITAFHEERYIGW